MTNLTAGSLIIRTESFPGNLQKFELKYFDILFHATGVFLVREMNVLYYYLTTLFQRTIWKFMYNKQTTDASDDNKS